MPPTPSQTGSHESDPSPGLQVGDIYYILFRHKWKILICTLIGLVAAGILFKQRKPYYTSQAKLMVLYVVDSRVIPTANGEVHAPGDRSETIMNAEIEILTSFDLLREVASAVGPERVLGADGMRAASGQRTSSTNGLAIDTQAANVIKDGLRVSPPGKGNVLTVAFAHLDPAVSLNVLEQLISLYFDRHKKIHSQSDSDVLMKSADEVRTKLNEIEAELRDLKSKAKVVSIEDTMKAHLVQISMIRNQLVDARAEFAEKNAAMQSLTNRMGARATMSATNPAVAPLAKFDDYRRVVTQLDSLLRRELEMAGFTTNNPVVRDLRGRIDELQQEKFRMEQADPGLARALAQGPAGGGPSAVPAADPAAILLFQETTRVAALTAKIAELTNQLAKVESEAAKVEEMEVQIRDKEREKAAAEAKFKAFQEALDKKKLEDSFGPGKLPNIVPIQQPTPPATDSSKFYKKIGLVAGGGLGVGLALAFLLELFLDTSIRRAPDLSRKLRLPVFITVPRLTKIRSAHRKARALLALPSGPGDKSPVKAATQTAALQSISANSSVVQPYCDALRDRLIHYFQRNNMSHKPKLVAVTGCRDGSGVSTLAAGLAASLSETGDGNVLLVDTNVTEGAAHPFYRGKLACGLNDVLKEDLRSGAQVQDNLYVASASESDGALIKALPKRFSQLVPKLKASDYDYIIFDMPQISQTSITTKLAGYMDIVLLVVESEKTSRSIVGEAAELLRESRANVATVLNKNQRYIPRWLHREFE